MICDFITLFHPSLMYPSPPVTLSTVDQMWVYSAPPTLLLPGKIPTLTLTASATSMSTVHVAVAVYS